MTKTSSLGTPESRTARPTASSLLVVVHIGGVDEPSARLQQGGDGVVALLVGEAVGPKAHNGHLIAAVQGHGPGLKIKGVSGLMFLRISRIRGNSRLLFRLGGTGVSSVFGTSDDGGVPQEVSIRSVITQVRIVCIIFI